VDILALDLEEGGESAAQIIQWLDYVQGALPNLIMIYSAKIILDPIPMTEAQKARLKQFPIWTAGYPWFPDLFSSVPSGYVPDQSKWGPVWLWQYSSHGKVEGISGDVDCNWISPVFYEMIKNLGSDPTPEPDPEPTPGGPMQGRVLRPTNIRNAPGATAAGSDIGDLYSGDIVTWDRAPLVGSVTWYHLTDAKRNGNPIITIGGLNVSQRADCYAYGVNIEPIGSPDPAPVLPVLNVTVSGEGYTTQIVELRPK